MKNDLNYFHIDYLLNTLLREHENFNFIDGKNRLYKAKREMKEIMSTSNKDEREYLIDKVISLIDETKQYLDIDMTWKQIPEEEKEKIPKEKYSEIMLERKENMLHKEELVDNLSEFVEQLKVDYNLSIDGSVKIKWNGSTAQFGYIMNLLAEKGYLEFPITKSKKSYSKFAEILFRSIDANTKSLDYLKKQMNPNDSALTIKEQIKLQAFEELPKLSDIQ